MAGDLFYRRVSPEEIKGMAYHELRYWNRWFKYYVKGETPP